MSNYTVPEGIKKINQSAFINNEFLEKIILPKSAIDVHPSAFEDLSSLKEISVNEANAVYASVDGVLFNKSRLRLIAVPAGRTEHYDVPKGTITIEDTAFFNSSLTSVTVPDSVIRTVGYVQNMNGDVRRVEGTRIFINCKNLKTVRLDANFKQPNGDPFYNCPSLESVYIGKSINFSDNVAYVFQYCPSLINFEVDPGNKYLKVKNGLLLSADEKTLIKVPSAMADTCIVPASVRETRSYAFTEAYNLNKIIFLSAEPPVKYSPYITVTAEMRYTKTKPVTIVFPANSIDAYGDDFHMKNHGFLDIEKKPAYFVRFKDGSKTVLIDVAMTDKTLGNNFINDPIREGYTFGGWFTQKNGGGHEVLRDTEINADIDLYAHWIKN